MDSGRAMDICTGGMRRGQRRAMDCMCRAGDSGGRWIAQGTAEGDGLYVPSRAWYDGYARNGVLAAGGVAVFGWWWRAQYVRPSLATLFWRLCAVVLCLYIRSGVSMGPTSVRLAHCPNSFFLNLLNLRFARGDDFRVRQTRSRREGSCGVWVNNTEDSCVTFLRFYGERDENVSFVLGVEKSGGKGIIE